MHRELWGPDVRSAREAAGHIDRVLADEIAELAAVAAPVIIDFGCGVGGTLLYLAERFPDARLTGVTVSNRQVEIARRFGQVAGYADRCSFVLGDFQSCDLGHRADCIVAVEAFVHSASTEAFLTNAARHLRPRGHLIIVDDFLASEVDSLDAQQRRRVHQFRSGWRVPSVCTTEHLIDAATTHGLMVEKSVDLTPLTRPGSRARDRLTAAASPVLARLGLSGIPFCGNLIGGNALQIGLKEGFIGYHLLVFQKADESIAVPS
jgi:trans-aconitate methyltransferase